MRNTVFISSELALAEPVPLTFAILRTKSFTRLFCCFPTLPRQAVLRRARTESVTVDFCMSQAPVGQRSAHSPQCTHRFSSLSITRAVCLSGADTKSCCSGSRRAALRRADSSASSPFGVIARQSTGQMSMHASHSMHRSAVNTVCRSQFKQRSTSVANCSALKPSSTSMSSFLNRLLESTCGMMRRAAGS